MKIDKRRHYILVLDTETANTLRNSKGQLDTTSTLVYDCGWCVCDTKGNVYEERSFVNMDIFDGMPDLMKSAYYGWKIPFYLNDLACGQRIKASTYDIRQAMLADMELYGITEVYAHNARFDMNSLNTTLRWTTKSKYRYWFPFGTTICDTLRMSRDVILKMPTYKAFCEMNNMLTATGRLSATAESLYAFITKNPDFQEEHRGLEDVRIEREILWYCYRQHKKMRRTLYDEPLELNAPPTAIQSQIMYIAKVNY